ncbi:MAG: hypothetical protein NZM18_09590 [Thermoflexales bacterium]|nr:hypothetical protein [Thermoflexales bacterium]MDW8351750.1 hypothetical protein [Anaerolineae bacterium]
MARATRKLTPEDIAWLEHQLSAIIAPVTPRPEFILSAKQALMNSPAVRPLPMWMKRSALAAAALSLLSLIAMLFYLRRRCACN